MAFDALSALLLLSAVGNGALATLLYRRKRQKREPTLSLSAEDLLHDLTRGPAVIRVEVIDAQNLFLRSPRK